MILFLAESGKVYEAFGANLESPEGQSAGHFADSEALLAFLQEHPDTAYHLDPVPGRVLRGGAVRLSHRGRRGHQEPVHDLIAGRASHGV